MTTSPLHAAYQSTLAGLPLGTLLLWRLGDFYEIFGEGAKIAAPVLQVALTRRNDIPMAGIPVHAQDAYLAKLTAAGLSFALATDSGVCGVYDAAPDRRQPTPTATRHALTGAEACRLLSAIRAILWRVPGAEGEGGDPDILDPDKDRSLKQLDALADAGLAPTDYAEYQDIVLAPPQYAGELDLLGLLDIIDRATNGLYANARCVREAKRYAGCKTDARPQISTAPDLAPPLEPSAPPAAGTDKPSDHSANRYGAFLLEEASRNLEMLNHYAIGAYSACTSTEQIRSITANLERAREIAANREGAR